MTGYDDGDLALTRPKRQHKLPLLVSFSSRPTQGGLSSAPLAGWDNCSLVPGQEIAINSPWNGRNNEYFFKTYRLAALTIHHILKPQPECATLFGHV